MAFKDYKTPILLGGYHNVTSDFGLRYIFGGWEGHNGIDVVGKNGADYIISYADGVVTYAMDNSPSAGVYVVIHHEGNLCTRYLHMQKGSRLVSIGDTVKKGQKIGYMGTTGRSTGVHLHFDITLNGNRYGLEGTKLNPNDYLFAASEIPPEITSIVQTSSTTVQIEGSTNGGELYDSYTRCYYKWGIGINIDAEDFDDYVDGEGIFKVEIEKPRTATHLTVLPVQIRTHNEPMRGESKQQELQSSYPCVQIITPDRNILNATPHIYTSDGWKEAIPTIRDKNGWYELYNTDKERVK